MNILVTGANGQLGTEMRNISRRSADRFIFSDVSDIPGVDTFKLDITDPEALASVVKKENVGVIVNCAAYTNVDKAEDDPSVADLLNRQAAANLADVAAGSGAVLIHISTDYVFGGNSSVPYREDDPKSPLGVYGRTKLAGEDAVIGSGCRYLIFRTAWLYSPYGRNFVKTMMRLTSEKDSIGVVFDQVGSPTCAADLAETIGMVIETRNFVQGVYHFSDEGAVSWYDFTQEICALSGNTCSIRPIRSEEFPSKVRRPNYSVLDKTLVKKTFGIEVPYWKKSLEKCIQTIKENGNY